MPLEQMIEGYHRDEMLLLYFSPIMEFKYLWELMEMFMAAHTPASWASTTQAEQGQLPTCCRCQRFVTAPKEVPSNRAGRGITLAPHHRAGTATVVETALTAVQNHQK